MLWLITVISFLCFISDGKFTLVPSGNQVSCMSYFIQSNIIKMFRLVNPTLPWRTLVNFQWYVSHDFIRCLPITCSVFFVYLCFGRCEQTYNAVLQWSVTEVTRVSMPLRLLCSMQCNCYFISSDSQVNPHWALSVPPSRWRKHVTVFWK